LAASGYYTDSDVFSGIYLAAPITIYSWNVNGIRAAARKGFFDWLKSSRAQIVGLQEVRASEEQVKSVLPARFRWHHHTVSAEKKGYSGVAMFSRLQADHISTTLDKPHLDNEGRVQIHQFGNLTVCNAYFPNGSGRERDNSRVPYKLDFYQTLFNRLQPLFDQGKPVVVMGDFNTAHREIDLARPRQNRTTSGFLQEECAELDRWIAAGWTDSFRHFTSDPEHYTWWSQQAGVRERNVGWRIDYILVSPGALPYLEKARIHPNVRGSDHCPVSISLDRDVIS